MVGASHKVAEITEPLRAPSYGQGGFNIKPTPRLTGSKIRRTGGRLGSADGLWRKNNERPAGWPGSISSKGLASRPIGNRII